MEDIVGRSLERLDTRDVEIDFWRDDELVVLERVF
jgi:hypothetical protein